MGQGMNRGIGRGRGRGQGTCGGGMGHGRGRGRGLGWNATEPAELPAGSDPIEERLERLERLVLQLAEKNVTPVEQTDTE